MFKKIVLYFFIFVNLHISELVARDYLIIQSTTSTENSGLLKVIEDSFEKEFSIDVRFVVVGTGQAIKNAKNGDADILLVHSKKDEIQFVEQGFGAKRYELMYNDFVIVGPINDPANIEESSNIKDVMKKLKLGSTYFISRDDNSGTYKKELDLWQLAEINLSKKDKWYLKNGMGMGATLNMASELDAYTISDRATWLSHNNRNFLKILFEKDISLSNPYSIIPINPKKFSHVEYNKSMIFINWLTSDIGKSIINDFKFLNQQLFFTY